MTPKKSAFRDDINGLRAWAVVSVILYHFGIAGFYGGFVGVDIFFVISGFLMTGIIVSGLEKSSNKTSANASFSILNFYLSRGKRIIPALAVLCAFLMGCGWLVLSPIDYKILGTHAVSSLGFISNIKYFLEAGYFDSASSEKLLLHTWSLSVEWQFYIILPLVLVTLWKIRPGRGPATFIVGLGLLLSLLLCVFLSPKNPSAAFYLLPTRAWEMLAGGMVYLMANKLMLAERSKKIVEAIGFAMIIASIVLFDASSNWPGWRAMVPVMGTVLILIAARQGSLFTGSRVAQWLGNCSYSLYLWHWPFVVALVYLQRQGDASFIAIGLLLTVVFGWLSYRVIEIPTRNSLTRMPSLVSAGALLAAILLVTLPTLLVRAQQGFPGRFSPELNAVFAESENKNPRAEECSASSTKMLNGASPVPACTYGDGDNIAAVVVGDSHAAATVNAFAASAPQGRTLGWIAYSCPLSRDIESDEKNFRCGDFIQWVVAESKKLPANVPVVIVNRISLYNAGPNEVDTPLASSLEQTRFKDAKFKSDAFSIKMREDIIETTCELAKSRPVYMLSPIPEMGVNVPNTMGRALMQGTRREVSISLDEYKQRQAFALETLDIAAKRCGVTILDPVPYLCSNGRCTGDVGGVPIYVDDDHLSERGAKMLTPLFQQVFQGAHPSSEAIAVKQVDAAKAE